MKNKNNFLTKDLNIAAYFYTQNIKFLGLQKSETASFFYFVFSNPDECQKLEQKFWAKEGLVDAKTYTDSLRALKQQVFKER